MDSLTQIILGAAVGEAVLGRKVGNKAPLWGAVGGTIPDLDVIIAKQFDPVTELIIHRGFSHSLAFCLILAPILGWLVFKLYKGRHATSREWTMLFFWSLFTHPLLDIFTTWGTQLFWPLEHRFAFKSIFVIDPLYTVPFVTFLILAMRQPKTSEKRRRLNWWGLRISTAYLFISLFNQSIAVCKFESEFSKQNIDVERFEVRATPFNTVMWACNAETEDAYHIGYYSFFDAADRSVDFFSFPKNHDKLEGLRTKSPDLDKLLQITNGYYSVRENGDNKWIIHDLRFGQVSGFFDGKGEFVFSYLIELTADGKVKIDFKQRELKEGRELLVQLWSRLLGDEEPPVVVNVGGNYESTRL